MPYAPSDFIWNIPDLVKHGLWLAPLSSVYIKPVDSLVPVRKSKFLLTLEEWRLCICCYCSHDAAVIHIAVLLLVTMKTFSFMFFHYRQSRLEQTKSTSGSCHGCVISATLCRKQGRVWRENVHWLAPGHQIWWSVLFRCVIANLIICYSSFDYSSLMLLNWGAGEDSWQSLGLQGDPTSPS